MIDIDQPLNGHWIHTDCLYRNTRVLFDFLSEHPILKDCQVYPAAQALKDRREFVNQID